ncbi:MAG: O-antigen ligase family protein, partial [Planctomycetaceae bacterium]|nr:O-antigen ligase family protein [Planctomycetaceae bacterium]
MVGWSQQSNKQSSGRSGKSRRSGKSSRASFENRAGSKRNPLDLLEIATDISLYATIFLVLMLFGGRTPTGQIVLLAGTALTACLWFIRRGFGSKYSWKLTGLEPIFLLAVGLFLFQLMPIPDSLLSTVSPSLQQYLGNALPSEIIPTVHPASDWNRVSLSPRETRLSLVAIICVITLFLIMVQRFQDRQRARHVVLAVGLGSAGYAIFGVLQQLLSNNKFLWIYDHPYTGTLSHAKGTFTNANHFAGLLALSLGPLLAWTLCKRIKTLAQNDAWQAESRTEWHLIIGAIAMASLLVGIVLTGSRGGLLLAVTGIAVTLILIVVRNLADARLPIILSLGAIFSLGGIAVVGDQILQKNAEELISGDLATLGNDNARSFIWSSSINAWQQFPWVGTGLGTHEDIIPAFHVGDVNSMNYTHAENSYLQIGTENGLAGWLLLSVSVLIIARALYLRIRSANPERSDTPFMAGIAGSFCVFLVHGCYDFAWYAPAYMLVLGVYLAFLFSHHESQSSPNSSGRPVRYRHFAFAVLVIAAGVGAGGMVWSAAVAEQDEFQYVKYSRQGVSFGSPQEELNLLRLRILSLKKSLHADNEQSEVHLRMAKCLQRVLELQMKESDQAMPLSQIRAAVYSGGFESQEQLQAWLNNPSVMKKSLPLVKACLFHAKQSLKYCPFKSTPYLIHSNLCFTESPDSNLPNYYLARSKLVEPWSANIPYTAGMHAWGQGEIDTAIEIWKEVYPQNEKVARKIIENVSKALPADTVDKLFEPDLNQLIKIVNAYKPFNEPQGQAAILLLARRTLDAVPEMTP